MSLANEARFTVYEKATNLPTRSPKLALVESGNGFRLRHADTQTLGTLFRSLPVSRSFRLLFLFNNPSGLYPVAHTIKFSLSDEKRAIERNSFCFFFVQKQRVLFLVTVYFRHLPFGTCLG